MSWSEQHGQIRNGWLDGDAYLLTVIDSSIFLIFIGRDKLLFPLPPSNPALHPPFSLSPSVWSIASPSWIPHIRCHTDVATETPEAKSCSGALAFLPCSCQSVSRKTKDSWTGGWGVILHSVSRPEPHSKKDQWTKKTCMNSKESCELPAGSLS